MEEVCNCKAELVSTEEGKTFSELFSDSLSDLSSVDGNSEHILSRLECVEGRNRHLLIEIDRLKRIISNQEDDLRVLRERNDPSAAGDCRPDTHSSVEAHGVRGWTSFDGKSHAFCCCWS